MANTAKIKAGLFFGVAMTVFYILYDLLSRSDLTTKDVILAIVSRLVGGAFSGFLFGWLMGLFVNSKQLMQDTKIDVQEDENILFDIGANHFKGAEGVGGKLYLTNKRLVFKSHKFNIQNHERSINLSEIDKVGRYKTLGLLNNGLTVRSVNNKIDKFVVEQTDEWFNKLIEMKSLQQLRMQ